MGCLLIPALATQPGFELVEPSLHGNRCKRTKLRVSLKPHKKKRPNYVELRLNAIGGLLKARSFTHVATPTPSGQAHTSTHDTTRGQHNQ